MDSGHAPHSARPAERRRPGKAALFALPYDPLFDAPGVGLVGIHRADGVLDSRRDQGAVLRVDADGEELVAVVVVALRHRPAVEFRSEFRMARRGEDEILARLTREVGKLQA